MIIFDVKNGGITARLLEPTDKLNWTFSETDFRNEDKQDVNRTEDKGGERCQDTKR